MAGRPSKYKPEFVKQAEKLCILGATDKDLAEFFEVNVDSIYEWKNKYPEFSEALKKAKDTKDQQVEDSLLKRALGFSRTIERLTKDGCPVPTTEEIPPDPTSMIFWLKNRQPKRWRDKQEVEHSGSISINVSIVEKGGSKP